MRYFHDCGGIHAPGPAWQDLPFECIGMTEIDKFPIAVTQFHYPNIPQHGDTTKISLDGANLDLLIGGTPCQGFSVAGKRGGLDDKRSNLAWNFLRLAAESRARWLIWENVPGASSTNEGQDLLAFFGQVEKLGYGFCSRTLDAQYFGVPQRRRRIFLVGYLGDWRPAAAVLLEQESLSRNPPPRRTTRERTANAFEIGPSGNRETELAPTLDARCKDGPIRNQIGMAAAHTLLGKGYGASEDGTGRGIPLVAHTLLGKENDSCDHTLQTYVFENHAQDSHITQVERGNNLPLVMQPVSFDCVGSQVQTSASGITQTLRSMRHDKSHQNRSSHLAVCAAPTLTASNDPSRSPQSQEVTQQVAAVYSASGTVRRLTPNECARLQGFPDNWCKIPWRGKPAELCPDGPQYKAYGNSIAVPVLRWLGKRIVTVAKYTRRANEPQI